MHLAAKDLDYKALYKIMIAAVAPRPIAWVGTCSTGGVNNLAPYSFFNAFSSNPPIVGFSAIPREDGSNKDSLQNAMDTGGFTLSCVSHALVPAMSRSSAALAPDEDEFSYAGVTPAKAQTIDAPYVKEALLVFECALQQTVRFGDQPGAGTLVLGEIVHLHVDDSLWLDNGRLDQEKLDLVGRLAGNYYSTTRDTFERSRG